MTQKSPDPVFIMNLGDSQAELQKAVSLPELKDKKTRLWNLKILFSFIFLGIDLHQLRKQYYA